LLVGANLMVRSFLAIQHADLGFDDGPILSGRGYLAGDAYNDIKARTAFYQNVVATLSSLPGASAAVVTTSIPGDDGGSDRRLVIDGRTGEADLIDVQAIGVTPGLFDTINRPLLEGRDFTGQETENEHADVALINQQLAERLWPGESPLDRRIGFRFGDDIQWMRVVGVAPNVSYEEVGEETDQSRLNVYVPYAMDGSRPMAILVRANGSPDALIGPARDALRGIGPTFPVFRLMPTCRRAVGAAAARRVWPPASAPWARRRPRQPRTEGAVAARCAASPLRPVHPPAARDGASPVRPTPWPAIPASAPRCPRPPDTARDRGGSPRRSGSGPPATDRAAWR